MDILPDSPADLLLRGFDQASILEMTNYDVGYHGSGLKRFLKGIDRNQYRIDYVLSHHSYDELLDVLREFENGLSKEALLTRLGLRAFNLVKLHKFFGELGLASEFKLADSNRRKFQMRAGARAKFGVENVFELEEFQDKAIQTRIDKYGGAYTLSRDSSLAEGARQTALKNLSVPEFKKKVVDKRQATMLENYGAASAINVPEFNQKMKDTLFERYGVTHWSKSDVGRATLRETQISIASDPIRKEEVAAKRRATTRERYGVDYYPQLESHRQKTSERMSNPAVLRHLAKLRNNGVSGSSNLENTMFDTLCARYGKDDVRRQYKSEEYPWTCDFYIVSEDLYIELNGFWTHGGHWFDSNDADDIDMIAQWECKNTKFFDNAIKQWTERDVVKRQWAIDKDLNYLVFWDGVSATDFELWINSGCPVGKDQYSLYSWLPFDYIDEYPIDRDLDLKFGNRNVTNFAHNYTGNLYFQRELSLWNDNPAKGFAWGNLHMHLFLNRYKYISKTPFELNVLDILRGLSIMGKLRRYSSFKSEPMRVILDRYSVKSIYDPCAGWGERLLTSTLSDVAYFGVDINEDLIDGLNKMIDDNHLEVTVECADSSAKDMTLAQHDAVFTCPPYGSKEIYTSHGAENLSSLDFINWWTNVVNNATGISTKYFIYQIDNVNADMMDKVLFDNGWTLVEIVSIDNKHVDHFSRKKGHTSKKSNESIRVFSRDVRDHD